MGASLGREGGSDSDAPSDTYGERDLPLLTHDASVGVLAEELATERPRREQLRSSVARVSPAVWPYAFMGAIALWSCHLIAPFVGYVGSSCSGHGFASIPPTWAVVICGAPAFGVSLWCEYTAYTFMHPLYMTALGPCKMKVPLSPITIKMPTVVWLSPITFLTVIAKLDVWASGLFMGRVLRTAQCTDSTVLDTWRLVAGVDWLAGLPCLATWVWLLCMSMDLAIAVLEAVPLSGWAAQQMGGSWAAEVGVPGRWSFWDLLAMSEPARGAQGFLVTVLNAHMYVNDAVHALTQSGRMRVLEYRQSDLEKYLKEYRLPHTANVRRAWSSTILHTGIWQAMCLVVTAISIYFQASILRAEQEMGCGIDLLTIANVATSTILLVANMGFQGWKLCSQVSAIWPYIGLVENAGAFREDPNAPRRNRRSVSVGSAFFSGSFVFSVRLSTLALMQLRTPATMGSKSSMAGVIQAMVAWITGK